MTSPSNSDVQNLLPVQAYFNLDGSFNTFIGQGVPFYATIEPSQSGLNITNSIINSTTIGLTTPAAGAFTNFSTNTGTITSQPVGATDIVNLLALQSYAAGISWKQPCAVATLTNITLSGLQTIDGYTTLVGDRVLVKDQSTAANNGIYVASAGAWSRSLDANIWDELVAAISFIEYGTQKGGAWFCTAQPGGTLGVTAVNWSQFTTSATYTAGTGLTLTGFEFSITNTGVSALTYGSATATPVFAVNAQGQITSVTNTTITPAIGNITGLGTGVATFLQTPTSANLAAAVTDETGSGALVFATNPTLVTPILGTPQSGDFSTGTFTWPTFNQNTTGTAGGLSTTLAIASGGTGQTTASNAFNALSPITTTGDIIIGNGTNSATRLGIGANATVLTSNGTTASWAALPAGMVYPGAGIANSTGSAWGTSYSTTGSGTVIALATSPSFTTPILGTPQSGNFSTGTFTWPTFNQNTTGTASNVTGTVAVANGGTGITSLTGLVYGNGTSAFTAASAAQVVSVIGSTAVTNSTNSTNTTNIAIVDDTTTNTTVYPVWSNGTTGNQPLETSSTKLNFNPSTGRLTATSFGGAGTGLTGTATSLSIGGNAATATSVSGVVAIANGGTNGTATPTAGGIAYGTGSAYAITAAGTSGQVLTSAGTGAPTWSTAAYPLTSGTAVASTSGTSIDFTSIPSWVKRVTVMFNEMSTNGSSNKLVQIGAGSVATSGYISTGIAQSTGGAGSASSTSGFMIFADNAGAILSGTMVIVNQNGNNWVATYSGKFSTTQLTYGGGSCSLGGTLDRVRITTVNGTDTFDNGSINILYE